MYCQKCGAYIQGEGVYCSSCGAPTGHVLGASQTETAPYQSAPDQSAPFYQTAPDQVSSSQFSNTAPNTTPPNSAPRKTPGQTFGAAMAAPNPFKLKDQTLLVVGGIIGIVIFLYYFAQSTYRMFNTITLLQMGASSVYSWGSVVFDIAESLFLLLVAILAIVFSKRSDTKLMVALSSIAAVLVLFNIVWVIINLEASINSVVNLGMYNLSTTLIQGALLAIAANVVSLFGLVLIFIGARRIIRKSGTSAGIAGKTRRIVRKPIRSDGVAANSGTKGAATAVQSDLSRVETAEDLLRAEWLKLDLRSQAVCFLGLSDLLLPLLSSRNYYPFVEKAMNACWEWVEHRRHTGDDLYTYAADENIDIPYFQYKEAGTRYASALGCIYDAVMQTSYGAYVLAGEIYLPQEFECATPDEIFDCFIKRFEDARIDGLRLAQRLLQHLSSTGAESISRESISKVLLP